MTSRSAFALILILATSSCIHRVQPWERDLLAEPEMQLAVDPMEVGFDEHIYFSKEAAHGGDGLGGGGCGCN
jgi:hypothetical protein